MEKAQHVRVDKWLWSVRLFKSRNLAALACQAGNVKIDGRSVKPSRSVKIGDLVVAKTGDLKRIVKVLDVVDKRVGPKLVPLFLEDHTPAAEYENLRNRRRELHTAHRLPGSGRPTKKQRRAIDQLWYQPAPWPGHSNPKGKP